MTSSNRIRQLSPFLFVLTLVAGACSKSADGSTGPDRIVGVAASLQLVVPADTLRVGQQGQMGVVVRDGAGNVLPGYPVAWSSSSTWVADVNGSGTVTALAAGSTAITATANGHLASTELDVVDVAPPPDSLTPNPPDTVPPSPPTDTTTPPPPPVDTTFHPLGTFFVDGFEGGYAQAQNGAAWTNKAPVNVTVSTDVAHTGTNSLRFQFPGKVDCLDASAEQRFSLGRPLREVWLEYWVYFPAGGEGGSARYVERTQPGCQSTADNNKFVTLFGPKYNGETTMSLQTWSSKTSAAGDSRINAAYSKTGRNGVWFYTGANLDPFVSDADRGQWMQIRLHARVSDPGMNNGVIQAWKNGQLVLNSSNLDWFDSTGQANFMTQGYLMGWSNSGFAQTTNIYVDDIRIMDTNPGW